MKRFQRPIKCDMKNLKFIGVLLFGILVSLITMQCTNNTQSKKNEYKILFLHHSTGDVIWKGGSKSVEIKGIHVGSKYDVPKWFEKYNRKNGTEYLITKQEFPHEKPYGWRNYPFDYYNIWVKHAGVISFMGEPTLEMLSKEYNMIIFKHCFPVTDIISDTNNIDIDSPQKTMENYKLQYIALKKKMLQFPEIKFLIWTGAARVQSQSTIANATVAKAFFEWVKSTWDTEGDNIFIWDFYELETEGELFLKDKYASAANNSHPNIDFAQKVAPYFCQRITDVIENNGTKTTLTGIYKKNKEFGQKQ